MTQHFHSNIHQKSRNTWTRRRVIILIIVAVVYGTWFNILDTFTYNNKSIGQMFGGNQLYQPWNIVGHIIPGLFLLFSYRSKREEVAIIELFIAGVLISTATMDSPLWGAIRLYIWKISLWPASTSHILTWILYYYNPIGHDQVWDGYWIRPGLPNAAMIFWSVTGRIATAIVLIKWQHRQEKNKRPVRTIKDLVWQRNRRGNSSDKIK